MVTFKIFSKVYACFKRLYINNIICKEDISTLFIIWLYLCYEGSNDAGLISGLTVGVLVCIGIAAALIILVIRRRNYIRKDNVSVFIYAMHDSF